jgi:hypothetical protein
VRRALLGALAAALASSAEAGPWALGHGHVYGKLSYGSLVSRRLAAPDGTVFDIPRFQKEDAGLYVAVGLGPRWNASVSLPVYRSNDLEDFRRESGIGDLQLAVQREVFKTRLWTGALRTGLQLPTGDETLAGGLLGTGSGEVEADLVLSVGRSLAGGKAWAFVETGPLLRGGALRDSWEYGGQLGWTFKPAFRAALNARGIEPFSKAPPDAPRGNPAGLSDRVTYLVYGPSVYFEFGRGFGLQLDLERDAHARNLARGTTYRGGITFYR